MVQSIKSKSWQGFKRMQLNKGELIRNIMISKKITTTDLSKMTGLSIQLINMALNGKRLSWDILKKLSKALEVDLMFLYSDINIYNM